MMEKLVLPSSCLISLQPSSKAVLPCDDTYMEHGPAARPPPDQWDTPFCELSRGRLLPWILIPTEHDTGVVAI